MTRWGFTSNRVLLLHGFMGQCDQLQIPGPCSQNVTLDMQSSDEVGSRRYLLNGGPRLSWTSEYTPRLMLLYLSSSLTIADEYHKLGAEGGQTYQSPAIDLLWPHIDRKPPLELG